MLMTIESVCVAPIADTILDFARVVLCQIPEPPALPTLQQTLELAISVWNAHALAAPAWGKPENLAELSHLVALSASPQMVAAFEALRGERLTRFSEDLRVVCEWRVTADELGRTRLDCSARLP
jgi:hypothetical protein